MIVEESVLLVSVFSSDEERVGGCFTYSDIFSGIESIESIKPCFT